MIEPPGQVLRRHGLSARKQWGQHFLREPSVHAAIVEAARLGPEDRVVEIGAGLGTLTGYLLQTGAEVWAIERDRDLCQVLRAELGEHPRFCLHEADAVRFDYSAVGVATPGGRPPTIVGNLPYHLTGPLLFRLLQAHAVTGPWVVMIQKEVADRLCAEPGSKTYGGITAALSRVRDIIGIVRVPPGAFLPPPKVDSAVIRLDPRATPRGEVTSEAGFLGLVRVAFQRRRKTLLNALSALAPRERVLSWCEAAGVDPRLRPERLGPEEFAAIQRAREADGGDAGEDASSEAGELDGDDASGDAPDEGIEGA
ncbi:16S rRNA (adenine(1518)-N(6)/adenine(1519)-N(6))-dimethyltransferase RsmA [Paraliomyxa miuraensis]|uniref:16S rRNA (adenine(1518)-N(6)/adenine(1519)-N(6))- dimethyltransferase RsmA n=1 Tax=Paraliomyxa miuraensis TaxID=376150 RepID=UPI00225215B9|nr:16S rRNA (adenine(1518)-N(6)/adenine(1519)-N(6))-dimethyltransferase RsmA [Paraliomyxa miuraensis]MCX4244063.1 16S rRNA (adenine(1518)-N(6)/adenine(1519)-N(6))-dimethyltransferase RsmA [Paraliomyxa miuraensis]